MVATGLCVLEVNLATMCELGGGGVSIVSMADRTLGVGGVRFAWASYVFIHYALLVAYVAKVGELAVDLIPAFPGGAPAASIEYVAALGGFLFLAESDAIERFNNALVVIVLALFFPLLALAGSAADPRNLIDRGDWTAVPDTIPVIALAFVFHNVIPVVSSSLEGDKSKIRLAIIAGTFIPFAMFALWDAAVLGSVGVDDVEAALRQGVKAPDPLATLQASSDAAKALVSGFSFFAVSTSFLGFVLGLTDFLADGMKTTSKGDAKPWAVALLPPTAFALAYPDIFLSALDKAGTFGVLTLFGCMPPLMAWRNREMQRRESPPEECELRGDAFACVVTSDVLDPIVPGGIVALGALGTLALAVVVNETVGDATGYLAARDF
jgi:tyrosine-specific transport protein